MTVNYAFFVNSLCVISQEAVVTARFSAISTGTMVNGMWYKPVEQFILPKVSFSTYTQSQNQGFRNIVPQPTTKEVKKEAFATGDGFNIEILWLDNIKAEWDFSATFTVLLKNNLKQKVDVQKQ